MGSGTPTKPSIILIRLFDRFKCSEQLSTIGFNYLFYWVRLAFLSTERIICLNLSHEVWRAQLVSSNGPLTVIVLKRLLRKCRRFPSDDWAKVDCTTLNNWPLLRRHNRTISVEAIDGPFNRDCSWGHLVPLTYVFFRLGWNSGFLDPHFGQRRVGGWCKDLCWANVLNFATTDAPTVVAVSDGHLALTNRQILAL